MCVCVVRVVRVRPGTNRAKYFCLCNIGRLPAKGRTNAAFVQLISNTWFSQHIRNFLISGGNGWAHNWMNAPLRCKRPLQLETNCCSAHFLNYTPINKFANTITGKMHCGSLENWCKLNHSTNSLKRTFKEEPPNFILQWNRLIFFFCFNVFV
jgi:hypothetical protein